MSVLLKMPFFDDRKKLLTHNGEISRLLVKDTDRIGDSSCDERNKKSNLWGDKRAMGKPFCVYTHYEVVNTHHSHIVRLFVRTNIK